MSTQTIGTAFREAVLAMAAVLATLACTLALYGQPGTAVLAVVLCLSLARSQLDRDLHDRIQAVLILPAVGLAATAIGQLLLHFPWLGAATFTAGMALAIWLRQFGTMARRAGSLIALPLVAILVTPHVAVAHASRWVAITAPLIVALLALGWVSAVHLLARRLGWLAAPAEPLPEPPARVPASTKRPSASTRMAIQMAIALTTAFAVGHVFFEQHWAWVVLTAFIVNSGNRGRLDVAHKSMLRVFGAAFGTVLALALARYAGSHPTAAVVLMLTAVFLGTWLRPLGYAWWALFATLALALLQGFEGRSASAMLWPRMEEIVVGALIGVSAAWWVLPVRSTDVLRRRLADALACLSEAFDLATSDRSGARVRHAMDQLRQVARAFHAMRWAFAVIRPSRPDRCAATLLACEPPALTLLARDQSPGEVRRAIGTARKAMREPAMLQDALDALRASLEAAVDRSDVAGMTASTAETET